MKELSPIKDLFVVKVPNSAFGFKLNKQYSRINFWVGRSGNARGGAIDLPPGSYEILFTTKDCTEEQAGKAVAWDLYEDVGVLAANYENDKSGDKKTCLESLQSLLRSKNLDPNKNYLLLRRTHP